MGQFFEYCFEILVRVSHLLLYIMFIFISPKTCQLQFMEIFWPNVSKSSKKLFEVKKFKK